MSSTQPPPDMPSGGVNPTEWGGGATSGQRSAPPDAIVMSFFGDGVTVAPELVEEQSAVLLAEGDVLAGRFEVVKTLGMGGMGAVYEVKDRELNEPRALKVMLPSLVANEKARERFLEEIKASQKLSHEYIVRVHDLGSDPARGTRFFTMELVAGVTLHRLLSDRGGKLAGKEALYIARQLCRALAYAHRFTIHRDLKPQNIMIQPDWTIKVLDFGLAKIMSPGAMTKSTMALGTAYYQAPEQGVHLRELDHRADIYSLGVILYQMLTGKVPVGRFKPPSALVPGLPDALDDIVLTCLEPEPEDRYETVILLGKALDNVATAPQDAAKTSRVPEIQVAQVPEPPRTTPVQASRQRPAGQPQAGEVREFDGMQFVWIPPGDFLMGSPEKEVGRSGDEGPQHRVTISRGFWMGKYAVTQAQWEAVMGSNPSHFKGSDRPVETVSWDDCQAFIKKLNAKGSAQYRMPTEGEWEYACRAGTTTAYCFGDDAGRLGDYAWHGGNSGNKTHPVGQKKPNAWGLHDMHGNVWEWCQDWKGSYSNAAATDPTGPTSGQHRVLRGGSWTDYFSFSRSAFRSRSTPTDTCSNGGFRVSRTP